MSVRVPCPNPGCPNHKVARAAMCAPCWRKATTGQRELGRGLAAGFPSIARTAPPKRDKPVDDSSTFDEHSHNAREAFGWERGSDFVVRGGGRVRVPGPWVRYDPIPRRPIV